MYSRQTVRNALFSVAQVLVNGLATFVLYRFALGRVGPVLFGVWTLVTAIASITRLSDAGLAGGVVKFVAQYAARGDQGAVREVVTTSVTSISVLSAAILAAGYFPLHWYLARVVSGAELHVAAGLLPWVLGGLWLNIVAGIFLAALDGYQRIDLRCTVLMGAAAALLVASLAAVPVWGVKGLVIAQAVQGGFTLAGSFLVLRRVAVHLPAVPVRWNAARFREMLGYGTSFQVMSVAAIGYDVTTKSLLSRFGGLPAVGYFEMANRLVSLLRGLIISASQVLVPVVADLRERDPGAVLSVYRRSLRALTFITLPPMALAAVLAPAISALWLGHVEAGFVQAMVLLLAGTTANILGTPAYYVNLGTGQLRWNTAGHLLIGVLNVVLGYLLGAWLGPTGAVVGWVASLVAGSALITVAYHLEHGISLRELAARVDAGLWATFLTGFGVAVVGVVGVRGAPVAPVTAWVAAGTSAATLLLAVWLHPLRRGLVSAVCGAVPPLRRLADLVSARRVGASR
jgi:O-antigen/teichoic acid export membrane protein